MEILGPQMINQFKNRLESVNYFGMITLRILDHDALIESFAVVFENDVYGKLTLVEKM